MALAPGESQSIRLQLTRTSEMQEGEYRSHIYFRSVLSDTPLERKSEPAKDTTVISISLKAVFGISVACIIRKGENNTTALISNVLFERDEEAKPYINFDIVREGNMSLFGDIKVNFHQGQQKHEVALIRGLAVYTPNVLRKCRIRLKDFDYSNGHFEILYFTADGRKKSIIAEGKLLM